MSKRLENKVSKNLAGFLLFLLVITGCKREGENLVVSVMEMKGKGPGWGHAIVVQTPEGKTYLYDTGSNYP